MPIPSHPRRTDPHHHIGMVLLPSHARIHARPLPHARRRGALVRPALTTTPDVRTTLGTLPPGVIGRHRIEGTSIRRPPAARGTYPIRRHPQLHDAEKHIITAHTGP